MIKRLLILLILLAVIFGGLFGWKLWTLQQMGAEIEIEHGYVIARAERLHGACIVFENATVGGTENLMLAAALAKGATEIHGAAREAVEFAGRRRAGKAAADDDHRCSTAAAHRPGRPPPCVV